MAQASSRDRPGARMWLGGPDTWEPQTVVLTGEGREGHLLSKRLAPA